MAKSGFTDPFKDSTLHVDDDDFLAFDDSEADSGSDVPIVAFPGHRDTLALLHLRTHHATVKAPARSLPSELLQQIYYDLAPLDFHAARHTCRKWFLASLDNKLLQCVTQKAGCSLAAEEDLRRRNTRNELRRRSIQRRLSLEHAGRRVSNCHTFENETVISEEWLMSKRLATEAHITPGKHSDETAMTIRANLDFRSLPRQSTSTKFFTMSTCGKFIIVNCGQLVYVFKLWPTVNLLTAIQCPSPVLAVSMDTSSSRYSIAVLLRERLAMCWDLSKSQYDAFEKTGVQQIALLEPITYEQLGSPDDPPISIAICPHRKCVAFGCRLGIELHWVDAIKGSALSRWFPLAAASDFLYFLPQRPGVDSSNKLRLISSAGGSSVSGLQHRMEEASTQAVAARDTVDNPSRTRLFFGSLPLATTSFIPSTHTSQGVLRTVECDHHRAIPLSDGVHVLFTDPISGLLCLGSNAPLGGPTKLIRKFVFLPPGYISTTTKLLPTCYSAAQNLQWGVRVAASYADGSIVLFNIPSDCFNYVRQIRNTPDVWDDQAGVVAQSDLLMDIMMDIQRASEEASPENPDADVHSHAHSHTRPFRTIQVPGVRITSLGFGVDALAVLCQQGGLRLWAFQSDLQARCWDISQQDYITSSHVTSDGMIEITGKGKSRDSSKSVHVHFGGMDGSAEHYSGNGRAASVNAKQIATSFLENVKHHHRSLSLGATPQMF